MRHDLVIRPFLTHPLTLGWKPLELVSQRSTSVAKAVRESYFWRGAEPLKKRPDVVIVPYGLAAVVAVVEEKSRQASLRRLAEHIGQVKEYQYLHDSVWGLLTDGEKWILQRNNATYLEFPSLSDVFRQLPDLQECISRQAIMSRLRKHGTSDLVIVRPSPSLVLVASTHKPTSITDLKDYLAAPSVSGHDLALHLYQTLKERMYDYTNTVEDKLLKSTVLNIYANDFADIVTTLISGTELLLQNVFLPEEMRYIYSAEQVTRLKEIYVEMAPRYAHWCALLEGYLTSLREGTRLTPNIVTSLADELGEGISSPTKELLGCIRGGVSAAS
jgi:hypothetical protein